MSVDAPARVVDPCQILAMSIRTQSKSPLIGVLELQTTDGTVQCQINEETAQLLSSDLDHFLSQS
jgi:hypothetical protein